MKPVGIVLLGCGTVGRAVVGLLRRNAEIIAQKAGAPLKLCAVADRSLKPDAALGLGREIIFRSGEPLAALPEADIVVELFGGIEPARTLILSALGAGKDVVTANKALLAEHGGEIFAAAAAAQCAVGFEAAVAGGVPIIRTLREALAADRLSTVYGIVNGTCNSILTMMSRQGSDFATALAEAKRLKLAEADPTLDIEGHDAAQKLCLLAGLAFGTPLTPAQVYTEGITRLTPADIAYARELGYAIKLLAIAKRDGAALEARVHPTMVPLGHLLANVDGAFNAIYVEGPALGPTMYFGQGAGALPTATAVVADIMELARQRAGAARSRPQPLGWPLEALRRPRLKAMGDVVCEYYLRFMVQDRPGVLGAIASVLGRHRISIASVIQQGRDREGSVPVIMRTHEARERDLKQALGAIGRLRMVGAPPAFVRIEEKLGS